MARMLAFSSRNVPAKSRITMRTTIRSASGRVVSIQIANADCFVLWSVNVGGVQCLSSTVPVACTALNNVIWPNIESGDDIALVVENITDEDVQCKAVVCTEELKVPYAELAPYDTINTMDYASLSVRDYTTLSAVIDYKWLRDALDVNGAAPKPNASPGEVARKKQKPKDPAYYDIDFEDDK